VKVRDILEDLDVDRRKIDLEDKLWDDVYCVLLAQDWDQWLSPVKAALDLKFP
jgi:hypothetical protein